MIFGLPAHPLVVHLVVVLLPLSVLALLAALAIAKLRRVFGTLALLGAVVGVIAAYFAKEAGESLEELVAVPKAHAQLGDATFIVSIVFAVAVAIWWVLERRFGRPQGEHVTSTSNAAVSSELNHPSVAAATAQQAKTAARAAGAAVPVAVTGGLAAIVGLALIALTVLTGHSGAQSVWGDLTQGKESQKTATVEAPTAPATPDAVTPPAPQTEQPGQNAPQQTTEAPAPAAEGLTLAEVSKHNTEKSCWAVVSGNVYDLTEWVQAHPGGARAITKLCGTDATAAFEDEHRGQADPNAALARFLLGSLQN